jgi:hypothetical protein
MLRPVTLLVVCLGAASVATSCSSAPSGGKVPIPFEAMLEKQRPAAKLAVGVDTWEVVVCRVPTGTTDPLYEPIADRMSMSASDLVGALGPVTDYFSRWSGGAYDVRFVASANEVSITSSETSEECVERALDVSSDDAEGVLVVADAQHSAESPGGRGRPGKPCEEDCSALFTRRSVYVGAADFMGENPDEVRLDLVEHELGHGLDWPHSSLSAEESAADRYDSPYDLMSNSAAAWEADPESRHGPGILAVDLLAVGWVSVDRVVDGSGDRTEATIGGRSDLTGSNPIMITLAIDDQSFATIELVTATGDDAFHGSDFVVIHRIDLKNGSGFDRRQIAVSGELREGDEWSGLGRSVVVRELRGGVALIEIIADA